MQQVLVLFSLLQGGFLGGRLLGGRLLGGGGEEAKRYGICYC